MENQLILIEHCCNIYNIEPQFVISLSELGLLSIQLIENKYFIEVSDLRDLEKYANWHYDLDISPEGIDVIHHLIDRMILLQNENRILTSKLKLYNDQIQDEE